MRSTAGALIGWRLELLDPRCHPAQADACAAWNHGQWGAPLGEPLDESLRLFRDETRTEGLPMTVVAVATEGAVLGAAMGMASLWETDGPGTEDRTPWLASVFVHPVARTEGLGSALVARVEDEARRQGFDRLNLFTTDAVFFYERLGWTIRGVDQGRIFMEKVLREDGA